MLDVSPTSLYDSLSQFLTSPFSPLCSPFPFPILFHPFVRLAASQCRFCLLRLPLIHKMLQQVKKKRYIKEFSNIRVKCRKFCWFLGHICFHFYWKMSLRLQKKLGCFFIYYICHYHLSVQIQFYLMCLKICIQLFRFYCNPTTTFTFGSKIFYLNLKLFHSLTPQKKISFNMFCVCFVFFVYFFKVKDKRPLCLQC